MDDFVDDAGVADDDGELIEPGNAFIDDGSVGTHAVEAKPQESLPLVESLPELELESEPEPLSDWEEAIVTILDPLGIIFKEKMGEGEVLTSMHNIQRPKWILHLNRLQSPRNTIKETTIERGMFYYTDHIKKTLISTRTIPLPVWLLLLNHLQLLGIKGSLFFAFLFIAYFSLLSYFTFTFFFHTLHFVWSL